jgi:hypothetical protein
MMQRESLLSSFFGLFQTFAFFGLFLNFRDFCAENFATGEAMFFVIR